MKFLKRPKAKSVPRLGWVDNLWEQYDKPKLCHWTVKLLSLSSNDPSVMDRKWICLPFVIGLNGTDNEHTMLYLWELEEWYWRKLNLKIGLKLNIQKTKIMASDPITSWEIDRETVETVSDFFFFFELQNHCRWWLQPWN